MKAHEIIIENYNPDILDAMQAAKADVDRRKKEHEKSGDWFLRIKGTNRTNGPYPGKEAATDAALRLSYKYPHLRGKIMVIADRSMYIPS